MSARPADPRDEVFCRLPVDGRPALGGGGHLCPLRRTDLRLAHEVCQEADKGNTRSPQTR